MPLMIHTLPTLQHERVDDIPLLWGMLQKLRLPQLLQDALGDHHLHNGLPNGTLAAVWITFILSEASHAKYAVEDWANNKITLLRSLLEQDVQTGEFNDDRLSIVLNRLHNADWNQLEQKLWDNSCEVYQIPFEGIRLDATTSYGYHTVTPDGLMQFGHSKDFRPDLPQIKLMAAVAQPTSHVVVSDIYPGHRADDELYLPMIDRVRKQLKKTGLLYLGDCKMAAFSTRADIAANNDYYLTVLPRTGDDGKSMDSWIENVVAGKQPLSEFSRVNSKGETELFAKAYEFPRTHTAEVGGREVEWQERVQLVCSVPLAKHHGEQLERRLEKAESELRNLTPAPGRGQRQHRDEPSLQAGIAKILSENNVEGMLSVTYHREKYQTSAEKKMRYVVDEVIREDSLIEDAKKRYGWRAQVTNMRDSKCSLLNSVLLYNGSWSGERPFHLFKDKPLGIQPMYVREDDQIDGMTKLLMIAMRVLTMMELLIRSRLSESGEQLGGLYSGQPNRKTSSPTARRLLLAVSGMQITLTHVTCAEWVGWVISPLPELLLRILSLLGLSSSLYRKTAENTS